MEHLMFLLITAMLHCIAHAVVRPQVNLIYEMDVLHWAHTFQNATTKLRGLRDDFGINTVWVLPPYQRFTDQPYATLDYYQIDSRLGTLQDVEVFVKTAHGLNMIVLFDITTIGHGCDLSSDPTNSRFPAADRDVSLTQLVTPEFPDLCAFKFCTDGDKVTQFFVDIMMHWVEALNIDGFRCDTASGISDAFYTYQKTCPDKVWDLQKDFWSSIISKVRQKQPNAFFIAETGDPLLYSYGFDAIYGGGVLVQNWGGDPPNVLIKAMKDGPSYYWKLERAIRKLRLAAGSNHPMLYTANHDLWDKYNSYKTPAVAFGDQSAAMCGFLLCLFSSSMVSIYNGQEIGSTQELDFNNADHSMDVDAAFGSAAIEALYKKAGRLYQDYDILFRWGDVQWDAGPKGLAIVKTSPTQRLGLIIGDVSPWHYKPWGLDYTLFEVPAAPSNPNSSGCRVVGLQKPTPTSTREELMASVQSDSPTVMQRLAAQKLHDDWVRFRLAAQHSIHSSGPTAAAFV